MPEPTGLSAVDSASFRTVMGVVCSQVVIATTLVDGSPHGTTITAFASLSLDPPLISVALDEHSQLLQQVRLSKKIGINLLAQGQEQLALLCAGKDPDKFQTVTWSASEDLPKIDDAVGWLACKVHDEILLGDHVLIVAQVIAGEVSDEARAPLVYAGRAFGTHSDWLNREPDGTHPLVYEPLDQWASWTD